MSQTKINGIGGRKAATTENLPAVKTDSFALTGVGDSTLNLPAEFAGEVDPTDFEGYETPRESLPIASIRQKELKDEKTGRTKQPAGGFKIYDPVAKAGEIEIADVDGDGGLLLTILADQTSRSMWQQGNFERPDCRSNDGITGVGTPSGNCAVCKYAQWNGTERPLCTQMSNLLVFDHALQTCYVLRLGRSGIRPYNTFKSLLKRQAKGVPVHALLVRVTTRYESEPAPYYTPTFQIEGQIGVELFRTLKALRQENTVRLSKTAEVDTADDEAHNAASRPVGNDPGGELPVGVTPVRDDEGLPF